MESVDLAGTTGTLSIATRGPAGPGEVQLHVRGTHESYLAYSTDPLPRGTRVSVVGRRGPRAVDVCAVTATGA